MKKRILGISIVVIAGVIFLGTGFWWGYKIGRTVPEKITIQGVGNIDQSTTTTADFGTFWEAWQKINKLYLRDGVVSDKDRVYGAIRGLVGSLQDPYSQFFSPQDGEKFQQDVQGSFGGIGVEIGIRKNQLVVIAPIKGTPGEKAGLKAGDQILKINTSSTLDMTIDDAVNNIRGPENTNVTLMVLRGDWEKPKDITIQRAKIIVPTLDYEQRGNVAYIQLYSFNANASQQFSDATIKAIAHGAKGMVLDLRNDPGGYLEVAVDLAGWFVPRGTLVVSEAGREGTLDELRANGNAALVKLPVVVLINKGSASAAEILAGALRDDRGVKLVGEQSFGKGTVQQLETLHDGSTIKLTIAHWVLPSGHILENGGLKPDVEVKLTDEDAQNKKDPQLDKALELVREEIGKK